MDANVILKKHKCYATNGPDNYKKGANEMQPYRQLKYIFDVWSTSDWFHSKTINNLHLLQYCEFGLDSKWRTCYIKNASYNVCYHAKMKNYNISLCAK